MNNVEYFILIECSKTDYDYTKIANLLEGDYSITYLKKLAYAHGILPLVFNVLNANKSNVTSLEIVHSLTTINQDIKKQNFFMLGQLLSILNTFHNLFIDCIPIKGPLLSLAVYDNPYIRQFSDLDILVEKKQFMQAAKQLELLGFKCIDELESFNLEIIQEINKDFSFIHEKTGVVVELHWGLDKMNKGVLINTPYLLSSARKKMFHEVNYKLLAIEIELFYLCVHGSGHRWERLEWICDIDRFIRKNNELIQWDELLTYAKDTAMFKMCILGIAVSKYFYNTPLTNKKIQDFIDQKNIQVLCATVRLLQEKHYFLHSPPEGIRWDELIFKLRLQDTISNRLRTLFYAFFPIHNEDILLSKNVHKISLLKLPFYRIIRKFKHKLG